LAEQSKSYSNTLIIRRHYQWVVGTKKTRRFTCMVRKGEPVGGTTAGELMRVIDSVTETLSWVRWE